MNRLLRKITHRCSQAALSRLLWVALLVLHLPALLSAVAGLVSEGLDPDHLGSFLGLIATLALFILKIGDVRWLQFGTDRRTWVALSVAIALIHSDALATSLNLPSAPKELPLAGATLFTAGLTRVQKAIDKVASDAARGRRRTMRDSLRCLAAWVDLFRAPPSLLPARVNIPRAPPV